MRNELSETRPIATNRDSTLDALRDILAEFDDSPDPLDERSIDSAIRRLKPEGEQSWQPPAEWIAERMAFSFDERRDKSNDAYRWYAPMMSGTQQDGSHWAWPSIKEVDDRILDYWLERAKHAQHPVMRSRYAGLVWEFNPVMRGRSAGIEIARIFIDVVIEVATKDCHKHETHVWRQLAHAVSVSISINDQERIGRARDTVIAYEAKVGVDDKPGLWGRAFDLFYGNDKAGLSEQQRGAVIQDLEDRLERLSNPNAPDGKVDPWAAGAAAQRLARHFQRLNQREEIRRVLQKVERAFSHLVDAGANAMVVQAWFEQIERMYRYFGLSDDASRVRRRIHDLGPAARDELVPMEHKFEIKKEDMEAHVNAVLEGDVESAIKRFVVHYIPRRKHTERQLMELRQDAGLSFLFPRQLVDEKGRPVATIGSLDEDLDGHVIALTAQNMGVTAIFLRRVVEEMISRYQVSSQVVLGRIGESPLFDPSRRELLQRGLDAYFDSDPILALHLLVPQIEGAVRNLLVVCGGDVYRPNRYGGMDLRVFGDVLRDTILVEVLGADVVEYFRILYTDIRGFNLRNDLCHGMLATERFNMGLADRVFHSLMLLTSVREA